MPFHYAEFRITVGLLLLPVVSCCFSGCIRTTGSPQVVVYAALDREFSEPILKDFEKKTGIQVRTKFDTESTKTVGLARQLITEGKTRTRCDLFWNNEILNTLRLDELDLLEPILPTQAASFPAEFRSSENRWYGFAARARVLIVNTDVVSTEETPDSIYNLLDPRWKGKVAIAKPLFGTTATHAVCLFEALGETKAKEFFNRLKNNDVQILSGNKQVAEDVASGRLAFGLTDTDDAIIELESGFPIKIIYPDSKPGELGTLFIPNTIAVMRNSPNREAAKRLANYLLTAEVEKRLADGKSAQIPLHADSQQDTNRIRRPNKMQTMQVDFAKSVQRWGEVSVYLKELFAGN